MEGLKIVSYWLLCGGSASLCLFRFRINVNNWLLKLIGLPIIVAYSSLTLYEHYWKESKAEQLQHLSDKALTWFELPILAAGLWSQFGATKITGLVHPLLTLVLPYQYYKNTEDPGLDESLFLLNTISCLIAACLVPNLKGTSAVLFHALARVARAEEIGLLNLPHEVVTNCLWLCYANLANSALGYNIC